MASPLLYENMAATGARTTIKQAIKPHIPLIKFPLRSSTPVLKDSDAVVPGALNQILNTVKTKPSAESKQDIKPLDAAQIPKKYKRKQLTKEEMEFIEKGGPL